MDWKSNIGCVYFLSSKTTLFPTAVGKIKSGRRKNPRPYSTYMDVCWSWEVDWKKGLIVDFFQGKISSQSDIAIIDLRALKFTDFFF